MMAIKFNKFERIAGLLVLGSIISGLAILVSLAIKQGWFDQKVRYHTFFENADGVHSGTTVQIAGLKAGSVIDVELTAENKIRVDFQILSKFQPRVRTNSQAQLIRPFVIGERVLEVTVGSEKNPILGANQQMNATETTDLLTLLSGNRLGPYLEMIGAAVSNIRFLAENMLSKQRTEAMVRMFDRLDPLLINLNRMSLEVVTLAKQTNKNENLGGLLVELRRTTSELNKFLPAIEREAPAMATNMVKLIDNLSLLTQEFKVVLPALAAVAPELPQASRRALEALDEAVVLIKAMQKNMFLRGSVNEVREQEAIDYQNFQKENRLPASDK